MACLYFILGDKRELINRFRLCNQRQTDDRKAGRPESGLVVLFNCFVGSCLFADSCFHSSTFVAPVVRESGAMARDDDPSCFARGMANGAFLLFSRFGSVLCPIRSSFVAFFPIPCYGVRCLSPFLSESFGQRRGIFEEKSFCSLISSFILKSIFLYSAKTNLHSGNSEIGYNGIGC